MRCECWKCKTEYEIPDEDLGKTFECEKCGKKFIAPKPKTWLCPDCGTRISAKALWCPTCGRNGMYWFFQIFQILFWIALGASIIGFFASNIHIR